MALASSSDSHDHYHAGNILVGRLRHLHESYGCTSSVGANVAAARNGHLEVVEWIVKNLGATSNVPWIAASLNGHLEVLKWVRENALSWDAVHICCAAAYNGHMNILEWTVEQGCFDGNKVCYFAAKKGQLEVGNFYDCLSRDKKAVALVGFETKK